MKSKTRFFAAALFFVLIMTGMGAVNPGSRVKASSEVRATWISYIDFEAAGLKDTSEADFRTKVSAIYDGIAGKNLNTVYVHARAFNDAIYPSENFGWSEYITSNKSGPGYDPLAIMVELAHQKGLRIEAWMNPYRISTSSARTGYIKSTAAQAELARMLEYSSSGGQSCLVWNPADAEVRRLIAQEAGYIVKNYDVDGIHFDDYFYDPAYYGNTTAAQRRTFVNDLVSNVYSEIKSADSSVEFGISPAGNVSDCLEDGADVKTWLSGTGYIDYLVPQIYWSDSYGASGTTAMFSNRLNEFLSINNNGTDIYVGLALYKVASKPSLSSDPGWTNSSRNLAEQVEYAVSKGVKGFSLFSSAQLSYQSTQTELNNLMDMVRSEVTLNGISPGQLTTTAGKQETITVDASGGTELLYQYHIYNYQTKTWRVATEYTTDPSLDWTFSEAGRYQVMCFVKDVTSINQYDRVAYCETTVNTVPVTLNGISPDRLTTYKGKQETITVSAAGGGKAPLSVPLYNYQTGAWTMVRDYSTNPSLVWTFGAAGKYQVMCFIRDEASLNWYDKAAYCEVEANNAPEIKVNGMTPSQLTTIKGKQETITVDASGGTELLYQFHVYDYDSRVWGLIRDYSTNPTINWTFNATGRYQIMCLIKDKYSDNWYDKAAYCEATVNSNIPPVILNGITPSQLATTTGKQETVTVSASGGGNQLIYRYYIYNYQTRLWAMVRKDNADPTLKWTFNEAGNYQIMCFIRDIESTNSYDAVAYCETTVSAPEVSLNGISPSQLTTYAGRQETVTVSASGGTELLYQYHIYNYQTGAWAMVQDYSVNPSLAWTFSSAGRYQIMCFVRDRNSANWYDKAAYCETVVE